MTYQYKREPLSDDEVNRLTNAVKPLMKSFLFGLSLVSP
jgi:hypothetical protein